MAVFENCGCGHNWVNDYITLLKVDVCVGKYVDVLDILNI